MSLHRVLHMHENTVRGALEEIEKAGLARRDHEYLWWLMEIEKRK
jgi:DNA-binding IclR family transcriptional regulator